MATNAVPGAVAANRDSLHDGCWAEHKDGSLILVNSLASGRVVFEIFDPAMPAGQAFHDSMDEPEFKKKFSWPDVGDEWLWHDRTPFPWDRVMARTGLQNTAASRLIQRHSLNSTPAPATGGRTVTLRAMHDRLQAAIRKARPGK